MRLSQILLVPASFFVAAFVSLLAANLAVRAIETVSRDAVGAALFLHGHEWASIETDGLQVVLSGVAPDETSRFRAIAAAGTVIDAARVVDNITIPAAAEIKPPHFSIEILRNDDGISMIGLIPASVDRAALNESVRGVARNIHVTDLLEAADYPVPANWDAALEYALFALQSLPRSKISMDADKVAITALADDDDQKAKWARDLKRNAPRSVLLAIDISAPRPVITPFTLRFLADKDGARFDACSAHTTVGRAKIVSAATEAGMTGTANCTIGLGVPSPDWPDAVVMGIGAVQAFGGGSVTFSDADVTLIAPDTTDQDTFDHVVGELESALPAVYSLHAVLPEPVTIDGSGEGAGPPEFVATRSPEGLMQMRGRITNEVLRSAAESFARAKFGSANVHLATRLDADLPGDWPTRVLAGLEALSFLSSGVVVVQPDVIDIRGLTGNAKASAQVSQLLSERLGASKNYQVNVSYKEELDPRHALPSPEQCAADINAALTDNKITFSPGSANIEATARGTVDKIAEIMRDCADVRMEIAGYTDSQGREEMNQALSQSRAQAVLNALLTRRVLTSNLTAKGYGEADPIADNKTAAGREANRRIEFHLLEATPPKTDDQTDGAAVDVQNDSPDALSDDAPGEQPADTPDTPPTAATQKTDTSPSQPAPTDPTAPDIASVENPTPNDVNNAGADQAPQTPVDVQTPTDDDIRPQPRPNR